MKKEILLALLSAIGANAFAENFSHEQLNELLAELPDKPVPENLQMGAMCYDMALPIMRQDYTCTICGGKIVLTEGDERLSDKMGAFENYQKYGIPKLTKLGLNVRVDPACLCPTCHKEGEDELMLVITVEGKEIRTPVQGDDFSILEAFLSGQSTWDGDFDDKFPLKDQMPRIRQLLGLTEEE